MQQICESLSDSNFEGEMKVTVCAIRSVHHDRNSGFFFFEKAECTIARLCGFTNRSEAEHICCDPKDGELCLHRAKPEETLVEARSDSDVQIDRRMWV